MVGSSKINAAPALGPSHNESQSEATVTRPDLLRALKDQFGPAPAAAVPTTSEKSSGNDGGPSTGLQGKDDYLKFVEEMGNILRPPSS